jgi:hypothetical protein
MVACVPAPELIRREALSMHLARSHALGTDRAAVAGQHLWLNRLRSCIYSAAAPLAGIERNVDQFDD